MKTTMPITYFRPERPGPEKHIENAVVERLTHLFPPGDHPVWTAGSPPLGAGLPDIVSVSYEPQVVALANSSIETVQVLAYLRAVNRAKLDTIMSRLACPRTTVVRCLDGLLEAQAIFEGSDTFTLSPTWRSILPEIVTIEAKVEKWRDAVAQAARNQIFAHRSFVAVPTHLVNRMLPDSTLKRLGIGILAVDSDGDVRTARRARRVQPKVWTYYYKLAVFAADYVEKGNGSVCSVH